MDECWAWAQRISCGSHSSLDIPPLPPLISRLAFPVVAAAAPIAVDGVAPSPKRPRPDEVAAAMVASSVLASNRAEIEAAKGGPDEFVPFYFWARRSHQQAILLFLAGQATAMTTTTATVTVATQTEGVPREAPGDVVVIVKPIAAEP
jgi:hypothetical protein